MKRGGAPMTARNRISDKERLDWLEEQDLRMGLASLSCRVFRINRKGIDAAIRSERRAGGGKG